MRQYNARLKQLEARKKTEDRKKRTQRLIHIGAEVESILGAAIEDSDLPKLNPSTVLNVLLAVSNACFSISEKKSCIASYSSFAPGVRSTPGMVCCASWSQYSPGVNVVHIGVIVVRSS